MAGAALIQPSFAEEIFPVPSFPQIFRSKRLQPIPEAARFSGTFKRKLECAGTSSLTPNLYWPDAILLVR